MPRLRGVSRRRFMSTAAGTAVAPAVAAAIVSRNVTAASPEMSVVATVVRTTHSASDPEALRIGVRASVRAPDFAADNLVFVVEPVSFAASAAEVGRHIAEDVRTQVIQWFQRRDQVVNAEDIAVRVFGGVL